MLDGIVDLLNKWAVRENDGIDAESLAKFLIENNVVILPCAIDTKVWCLSQPCGGCLCFNETMKEEFIEKCQKCEKWEIVECKFDYEMVLDYGKFVFATKEEAKRALAEKLKELMTNENQKGC